MTNEEYIDFVQKEMQSILDIIERKNKDYTAGRGPFYNFDCSTAFGVDPLIGLMIRMGDKSRRLEAFASVGNLECESIEDAFRDLIGYSMLGLGMIKERDSIKLRETIITEIELTKLTDDVMKGIK